MQTHFAFRFKVQPLSVPYRASDVAPMAAICHVIIIIIIIIVWLVRCWTLPFLPACSRLVGSALDDRRLPDQVEWC